MSLSNKVAIITGASSGIGLAAARLFASHGAQLVLVARNQDKLDSLREELGPVRVAVLAGDAREEYTARQSAEIAAQAFGGLDIAFNNVGAAGELMDVETMTLEDWTDIIDVNLTSAFLAAKYQLPLLKARGGGSLVFTTSFVGPKIGFPGTAAYAAAKAGLTGLVKVLAAENGAAGVRVNALAPGGTDTPMNFANSPDAPAGTQEFIEGLHALKRLARPEEIAQAALFLASDAASFVTGTTLYADGGVSITRT